MTEDERLERLDMEWQRQFDETIERLNQERRFQIEKMQRTMHALIGVLCDAIRATACMIGIRF